MKEYIISNKKGILFVIGGLILLITMIIIHNISYKKTLLVSSLETFETKINEPETARVLTEEELLEIFLVDNADTIKFMADTFQIDDEVLKEKLRSDYQNINLLETEEFEIRLLEYLFALEDSEKQLFDNTITKCQDNKEYMLSLIKYFTNIYDSVDFSIAAAIAQIESNYMANSMLNKNNIFGGMSGGSLIRYKNIEYGILSYIKLLNDGYFQKGLTTIETIGRIYNPTYNEQGEKIAKPSWVSKVNKALEEFVNIDTTVDLATINSLKNQV